MMKVIHAAQLDKNSRSSSPSRSQVAKASAFKARIPPSRREFLRARAFMLDNRSFSSCKSSLFGFNKLMELVGVEPSSYFTADDAKRDRLSRAKLRRQAPVQHGRVIHSYALAIALSTLAKKARMAYRALRDMDRTLLRAGRDSKDVRLQVQDVRDYAMMLLALEGALRRSGVSGLHISHFNAFHVWTHRSFPGSSLEIAVHDAKGAPVKYSHIKQNESRDFNPASALSMWLRVTSWCAPQESHWMSSHSLDESSPVFFTASSRSWFDSLSREAAGDAMASIMNRYVEPVYRDAFADIMSVPSPLPAPSKTARPTWSSHSFRHTSISMMVEGGYDSEIVRVKARDASVAALGPYLEQMAPPSVLGSLSRP